MKVRILLAETYDVPALPEDGVYGVYATATVSPETSAPSAPLTFTGYDSANQLTADGSSGFGYDATGNRTNSGYSTSAGNRITTDGVWTYTHDAEGNVTKRSKGATSDTWVYGYDNRNQMVSAGYSATDGGSATVAVTYLYDALGRLIERDAWSLAGGASAERYGVDAWDPAKPTPVSTENTDTWAVLNGSNALQSRSDSGPGFDELMAVRGSSGAVSLDLADYQGSVRLVVDNSATVLATTSYSAFGEVTGGSVTLRIGYAGYVWDTDLQMWVTHGRVYDPFTGRFLQQDALGFAAGDPDLFRYVNNSPTNATDPSGQWILVRKESDAAAVYRLVAHVPGIKPPRQLPSGEYIIDEVTDPAGLKYITNQVNENAKQADSPAKTQAHYLLAALFHKANPHVSIVVSEVKEDQVTVLFDRVPNDPSEPWRQQLDGIVSGQALAHHVLPLRREGAVVAVGAFNPKWDGVDGSDQTHAATTSEVLRRAEEEMRRKYEMKSGLGYTMSQGPQGSQPDPLDDPALGQGTDKQVGVGAIDYTTFKQGGAANCWLGATLVAFAAKRPKDLAHLITDHRDDTYSVELEGGKYSRRVNPNTEHTTLTSNGQWARIIEAALIKQYGKSEVRNDSWPNFGKGITWLTGHNYRLSYVGRGPYGTIDPRDSWLPSLLSRANTNAIVICGTGAGTVKDERNLLLPKHTYAIMSVDMEKDRIRLRNPWGWVEGKPIPHDNFTKEMCGSRREPEWAPGEFWITYEEFKKSMQGLAVEELGK